MSIEHLKKRLLDEELSSEDWLAVWKIIVNSRFELRAEEGYIELVLIALRHPSVNLQGVHVQDHEMIATALATTTIARHEYVAIIGTALGQNTMAPLWADDANAEKFFQIVLPSTVVALRQDIDKALYHTGMTRDRVIDIWSTDVGSLLQEEVFQGIFHLRLPAGSLPGLKAYLRWRESFQGFPTREIWMDMPFDEYPYLVKGLVEDIRRCIMEKSTRDKASVMAMVSQRIASSFGFEGHPHGMQWLF